MEKIQHIFVAPDSAPRTNWREAFAKLTLCERLSPSDNADIVWVLLPEEGDAGERVTACRAQSGAPVIALSDVPSDNQGLAALGAGAAGYCNAHAAPDVLRQVAATVLSGGMWVGQWLLEKLLARLAQAAAQKFTPPATSAWAAGLTEREIEVARAVAKGANNKEIASSLDITERTVKAHLGAVFEKLKLRDRLQLTLLVNGVLDNGNPLDAPQDKTGKSGAPSVKKNL